MFRHGEPHARRCTGDDGNWLGHWRCCSEVERRSDGVGLQTRSCRRPARCRHVVKWRMWGETVRSVHQDNQDIPHISALRSRPYVGGILQETHLACASVSTQFVLTSFSFQPGPGYKKAESVPYGPYLSESPELQPTAIMPADGLAAIPTLEQKHNAVPARLLHKARRAKGRIQDIATKPLRPRQRWPVVPQGIERSRFFLALDELAKELGNDHVEVNDKPLDDGW